jgi:hypothetical protein
MKKAFLFAIAGLLGTAFSGDYVVIANPGLGLSSISKAELKRVFQGKISDVGGKKVTPINLPDDAAAKGSFLKDICGQDVNEYKEHWVEMKVKGNGVPPMLQPNGKAAKAMVAAIPGGLSYVPAEDADASVQVVEVK